MRLTGFMAALVTAAELDRLLAAGEVVALDVQYQLGGPPSRELYAAGHVPGALHLSLDDALAGPPGEGGRHPLPDPLVLQEALRECGIDDDSALVAYDTQGSLASARAWWVLRWAGLTRVGVLDGGLAAWRSAGLPVTTDPVAPERGAVTVAPGALPHLDADAADAAARAGRLLDVRAPDRFRGESEPIDPVAGHIPGARNAPMSDLVLPDGTLRAPAEIAEYAARLGLADGGLVATSCGSGVTAAQMVLALHEAGIEAQPYVGSWSGWLTQGRHVATGD